MGAYYTKEDITGYISRNTVIPFLFDAAKKECPCGLRTGRRREAASAGRPRPLHLPRRRPRHRTWNARQPEAPVRLDMPFDMPEEIAAGIDDVSKRGGWNAPARRMTTPCLPRRWREVVARRSALRMRSGPNSRREKFTEINDLITLNLDIERFARRRHLPERGTRAPARLLARHARRIGSRPHLWLRRVSVCRPEHPRAALYRLP